MAVDPLTAKQVELIADAMTLAAASMTTFAVAQVVITSSNALSATLLAAPVQQANLHTTELATTAKAVDLILGNGQSPPPKPAADPTKLLGLLGLMKANDGAPVVT